MFIIGLYILTGALLLASFAASDEKSRMALKKSWKSLENIMPQFLSIMLIIGIALAILSPQDISRLIGQQSGWIS